MRGNIRSSGPPAALAETDAGPKVHHAANVHTEHSPEARFANNPRRADTASSIPSKSSLEVRDSGPRDASAMQRTGSRPGADPGEAAGRVGGGIFISYRGEDSHSYGALLYLELSRCLGDDMVFLDSESIPAGADYPEYLLRTVQRSWVLLALIGPTWLAVADAQGRRRIDDPRDWIRRELTAASAAGVKVIPVLTDETNLPQEADLPVDISWLARCQYRRLRHREVKADLARLRTDLAIPAADIQTACRRSP